jgi:hypothetical protein
MKQTYFIFLVFIGAVLLSVNEVSCWGPEGHAIVADIAQSLLTTQATQGIQKYLNGQQMDQVSSIPDQYDHTPAGKWSEPLHFVNMNKGQTEFDFNTDCGKAPGCVVTAIQNYTKILKSQVAYGKKLADGEPNPLIFLIHFVGDAHQPLHIGYIDDFGGNDVKCTFFGDQTELHEVWDSRIIEKYNSDGPSFSKELQELIKSNSSIIPLYTHSMNVVDWANESFEYVRTVVYSGVSGTKPSLGQSYYDQCLPIVKERLVAGGIRLGYLINSIFQS